MFLRTASNVPPPQLWFPPEHWPHLGVDSTFTNKMGYYLCLLAAPAAPSLGMTGHFITFCPLLLLYTLQNWEYDLGCLYHWSTENMDILGMFVNLEHKVCLPWCQQWLKITSLSSELTTKIWTPHPPPTKLKIFLILPGRDLWPVNSVETQVSVEPTVPGGLGRVKPA